MFALMFISGGAVVGGIVAAIWFRTKTEFLKWIGIGAVVGGVLILIIGSAVGLI